MKNVPIAKRAIFHFRRTLQVEIEQEALQLGAEGRLIKPHAGDDGGYSHVLGIPIERLEARAYALKRKYKTLRIETCCRLLDTLIEDGKREALLVGIFLLALFSKRLEAALWPEIERWVDRLEAGEALDRLAERIIAPLSRREPEIARTLATWKTSSCPARKRIANASAISRDE